MKKKSSDNILKKMPVNDLLTALKMGLELSLMAPIPEIKQNIEAEIELVKAELLVKGVKVTVENIEREGRKGLAIKAEPIDLLALAPVKMNIPSPSELISNPTAPELVLSQRY